MTTSYNKGDDEVLTVQKEISLRWSTKTMVYIFDFEFKTLNVVDYGNSASQYSSTVLPFAAVDPDMLETMHAKLTELGGHPRPLNNPSVLKPGIRPVPSGDTLKL